MKEIVTDGLLLGKSFLWNLKASTEVPEYFCRTRGKRLWAQMNLKEKEIKEASGVQLTERK